MKLRLLCQANISLLATFGILFCLLSPQSAFATDTHLKVSELSQIEITGRVTGEEGTGLEGAAVRIKGTTEGTLTGEDGSYKISVPDEGAILIFSYVGYKTQEIATKWPKPDKCIYGTGLWRS